MWCRQRARVGVLLAFAVIFTTLQIRSFTQSSATWDEPIHLTAGYAALTEADYRVDATHPPFMRMWAALPLLAMPGVAVDTSVIDRSPVLDWLTGGYSFAHRFLYQDHNADRLLYAARFMVVLWGVLLGILIFCWAHDWLGFAPAVAALAFYTFEPNIAAHAQLVTTDLGATCFVFGAVYGLWRMCRKPSIWNFAALTGCIALAVVTKFSGVLLGPIVVVLLAAAVLLKTQISIRKSIGVIACSTVLTFIVIWAAYGFRYAPSGSESWLLKAHELPKVQEQLPLLASVVAWIDTRQLLPNVFTEGFLLSQATSRFPAYLAGEIREDGFWYYFPAVFLLKTPASLIVLLLGGLVLLVTRRKQLGVINEAFLILPILVYLSFAMASGVNLGLRHILPVYPFVLLIAASSAKALVEWRRRIGRVALLSLAAFWFVMFARVYPHTLTFFNVFAGGPENGLSYLADSNLDWGQDLKALKNWMDRENVAHVNLAYFGTADPAYYQIECTHLPGAPFFASESVTVPKLPGYVAISATVLSGLHLQPFWRLFYSGFQAKQPVANIGNSIRVYWVEHWPEGEPGLADPLSVRADDDTHALLGDALLLGLHWADHAVVHYRASLETRPNDSETLTKLGMALLEVHKDDEGIRILKQAATLQPDDGELQRSLAAALLMSRQIQEAEPHAEAAARLMPNDPVAHDLLGMVRTGTGRLKAAGDSFERALQLAPHYEDARRHLQLLENWRRNQ